MYVINSPILSEKQKEILETLIASYDVACVVVTGSHSHGTNHANSDVDIKVVFIPTLKQQILNTYKAYDKKVYIKDKIEISLISIGYYLQNLTSGDPVSLEVMFANPTCVLYHSNLWSKLVENRVSILSKNLSKLHGYVTKSQEALLADSIVDLGYVGIYDNGVDLRQLNSLSHVIRLTEFATYLLLTPLKPFNLNDADKHVKLKTGNMDSDITLWIMDKLTTRRVTYDKALHNSHLPVFSDNDLLLTLTANEMARKHVLQTGGLF